jgi:hypothetical protein
MRHITAKATADEKAREVYRKATPKVFRTLIGLMTSRDSAVAKMAVQRILEHVLDGSLPVDLDRLSGEQRRQLRELLGKVTVRRRVVH